MLGMQWRIQGEGLGGGGAPPIIFKPKWGPKSRKKFFCIPDPSSLSQVLDFHIVYSVFICTQLRQFWLQKWRTQKRNKSFGIGAAGNVAFITQWESQSDFYTGIRTRFSCSAKTLHHFLAACFTLRALLSFWWPELIFWRRMALLSKIASKFNFKRNRR